MNGLESNPVAPHEWGRLSVLPEKQDAFSKDLYFRECWTDVADAFAPAAVEMLRSLAILTLKPDAVVGRRMIRILDFVEDRGFLPLAVAPFRLTRHSMRELWRNDWHVYPVTRLTFSTHWYTSTESLLFVLQEVQAKRNCLPATVRLSTLKGSAIPGERKQGDLRTLLCPPNRILNFVHVTDEPADIVRELGILADRTERRDLLARVKQNWCGPSQRDAALLEIKRLESLHPEHDLDFIASLRRLESCTAVSPAGATRALRFFDEGKKLDWDGLCSFVDPSAAAIDRWDFICVASHLIDYERDVGPMDPPASLVAERWAQALEV